MSCCDGVSELADGPCCGHCDSLVLIKNNHALHVRITGVVNITKVDGILEGTFVPDGDFKAARRKVSWVANVANTTPLILTEFDNLISKDKLEEDDKFEDFINPNTMASTQAIGDAGLKCLAKDDVIQLERRGFYKVDQPYRPDHPLSLFMIPDGKTKAMSGVTGKLAHR